MCDLQVLRFKTMQFTAAKAQAAECAMMPSVAVLSEALRAPALRAEGHGSYAILHKSWDVYLRWLWDAELLLESHAYLPSGNFT